MLVYQRVKASTKLALENLEKNRWICFQAKEPAFSLEISRLLNFQGGKHTGWNNCLMYMKKMKKAQIQPWALLFGGIPTPLKNTSSSVIGIMKHPKTEWESHKKSMVPKHQPGQVVASKSKDMVLPPWILASPGALSICIP